MFWKFKTIMFISSGIRVVQHVIRDRVIINKLIPTKIYKSNQKYAAHTISNPTE